MKGGVRLPPQGVAGAVILLYIGDMDRPSRVPELIAALEELDTLWGVERTKRFDELLKGLAREVLTAEADRGVWQQTRAGNGTGKSVAAELGTSRRHVERRVSRHALTRS